MAKSCCGGTANAPDDNKKTASCGCGPQNDNTQSCGCGAEEENDTQCYSEAPKWMTGLKETPAGDVPQVSTKLSFSDTLGSWKARWGIGRMDYAVSPGLYCVGDPGADSIVLVTANYKMTFDRLRERLSGLDAWILVLDTRGINVWCAAGKGTFGTKELVRRIEVTGLADIVSHRELILPQLGAAGVSAHEIKRLSGFSVTYGPVRAKDIKAFLENGKEATKEMRTVSFNIADRIVLTPMEIVPAIKPAVIAFGVMFILDAIGFGHYGTVDLYAVLGALFIGCFLTQVLLPWIPGRAFAFKGAILGLLWAVGVNLMNGLPGVPVYGWLKAAAYILVLPAVSAFCAMNFTGSSTFTSLSGVDKEMKAALPTMIISVFCGVVLLLVNDFIAL